MKKVIFQQQQQKTQKANINTKRVDKKDNVYSFYLNDFWIQPRQRRSSFDILPCSAVYTAKHSDTAFLWLLCVKLIRLVYFYYMAQVTNVTRYTLTSYIVLICGLYSLSEPAHPSDFLSFVEIFSFQIFGLYIQLIVMRSVITVCHQITAQTPFLFSTSFSEGLVEKI